MSFGYKFQQSGHTLKICLQDGFLYVSIFTNGSRYYEKINSNDKRYMVLCKMQQELINDIADCKSSSEINEKYKFTENNEKISVEYDSKLLYSTDDIDIQYILEIYENFKDDEIVYVESDTIIDYIWDDIQSFKNSKYRLELQHILNEINQRDKSQQDKSKQDKSQQDKLLPYDKIKNNILVLYKPDYIGEIECIQTLVEEYEQHFLEVYYGIKSPAIRKFISRDIEQITECINRLIKVTDLCKIDVNELIECQKHNIHDILMPSINISVKKHIPPQSENIQKYQYLYKNCLNIYIVCFMFAICLWFSFN